MHQSQSLFFEPAGNPPESDSAAIHQAIITISQPVFAVDAAGKTAVCNAGKIISENDNSETGPSENRPIAAKKNAGDRFQLLSYIPPLLPEHLGSPEFKNRYGLRYPMIAGAMAHGIASAELVLAAVKTGMIGFFGAAGLSMNDLEAAIVKVKTEAGPDASFGFNLVFSGNTDIETATVNLYLKHGIRTMSAAGYLKLTLPLLHYRLKGIHRNASGDVVCPNKIIAKTSRLEIASWFLSPPPEKMIAQLRDRQLISEKEAELAAHIPVAEDLTAEADSGGHTDNRAAVSLLPSMMDLRDALAKKYQYDAIPCIGLGGGIASPKAAAAAFAMGADYVLTGSVNQSCVEAGTSPAVKTMLAAALQTDVMMAPSANMFERGIKVQVLKRGTLFAQRAARLFDIYRSYDGLDQLPDAVKNEIETKIFRNSMDREWEGCCRFFDAYDPGQLDAAETSPKRKMALLFRSYLGKSSKWAISGDPDRTKDYQVWCGPSIGAFNEWVRGSFLEIPENRTVETVSMNLLTGACAELRRHRLETDLAAAGRTLPTAAGRFAPVPLEQIREMLKK